MPKNLLPGLIFALALFPAHAQDREGTVTAKSVIDWNTARIQSTVTLDAKESGITLPTGRDAALEILDTETPTLLKDTYFSVLVDSSNRLGDSAESGQISMAELNRILDAGTATPPSFSLDLKTMFMTHTVTLAQLGTLFIKHKTPYRSEIPLETVATRAYTGIIVDARGALPLHGEYTEGRLFPCLFPRIWSTEMTVLYEKNMVKPSVASNRGIVRYSSSADEALYRERIGADPLRIVAREIYGQNRTDPVISETDSLKILSLEGNRKLLEEGRVVILCDADRLTGQTIGPVKDDNYYFTRKEITEKLEKTLIKHIDFSDTWEGMKMTIYDIRFKADTARILPAEQNRLDIIADALKLAGPNARFTIEGHTADVGKPSGERLLSVQRAQKIAEELAARGINAKHIDFTGFGGTRPLVPNDSDENRAKNRRVEITIHLAESPTGKTAH